MLFPPSLKYRPQINRPNLLTQPERGTLTSYVGKFVPYL